MSSPIGPGSPSVSSSGTRRGRCSVSPALDTLAVVAAAELQSRLHTRRYPFLIAVALAVLAVLAASAWLARRRQTLEMVALVAGGLQFWKPARPAQERRAQGAGWHREINEVLGTRRSQAACGLLGTGACLADATCFRFALIAVGVHVAPGVFLFAYGVGTIAALVPLVPAGLGVVETVVPALLSHAGVRLATGLAGVLAYRILGTPLPAIAGIGALVRLRLSRAKRRDPKSQRPQRHLQLQPATHLIQANPPRIEVSATFWPVATGTPGSTTNSTIPSVVLLSVR